MIKRLAIRERGTESQTHNERQGQNEIQKETRTEIQTLYTYGGQAEKNGDYDSDDDNDDDCDNSDDEDDKAYYGNEEDGTTAVM